MKISSQEVEYVANLARLEITDKEKEKFTAQLNDILLYIDKLNELDTKGVEPMSHAISVTNAFREDKILDSIGTENHWPTRRMRGGSFSECRKLSTEDAVKSSLLSTMSACAATFVTAAYEKSTPHSSGFARLASEGFYDVFTKI